MFSWMLASGFQRRADETPSVDIVRCVREQILNQRGHHARGDQLAAIGDGFFRHHARIGGAARQDGVDRNAGAGQVISPHAGHRFERGFRRSVRVFAGPYHRAVAGDVVDDAAPAGSDEPRCDGTCHKKWSRRIGCPDRLPLLDGEVVESPRSRSIVALHLGRQIRTRQLSPRAHRRFRSAPTSPSRWLLHVAASPTSPRATRSPSASRSSPGPERPTATTRWPPASSASTMTRPSPAVPPVTMTTLFTGPIIRV